MAAQFLADKTPGLPVLRHAGARQYRYPGKQREVTGQRQHHALGQRGNRQTQRVAVQPCQPRKVAQVPAKTVGDDRQHQGVEPDKGARCQPGEHAATVGLLPVQGADHGRGQLSNRGKGNLANGGQAGGRAEQAVADIGQQQDHHNRYAAHREHPVAEHFKRALGVLVAQQPRQQHVVGNHGRQRNTGDDNHAGGRRRTANKGQQGQRRVRLGQWQADHEGVGQYRAGQQHLPGQGNGYHKQPGQNQVGRKHPFGQLQVLRLDVFNHGDMELTGQADNRHHRHASLDDHRRPVDGFFPVLLKPRCEHGLIEQIVETVIEPISHKGADGEKGEQLDQ